MKRKCYKPLLAICVLPMILACAAKSSPEENAATLKSALKDKFLIGTALNADQINGTDTLGISIIKEQFNAIVAENCMKSAEIAPEKGEYDFELSDKFVEFGMQNDMFVTGHALIWHSQLAKWFCRNEQGELLSPEELKTNMKEHISTVAGRYKGKVKGWDVLNEAINDDGSWRDTDFFKILGEEYVYLAFQYAQEADPDAELYYNDYNEWHAGKRDAIVKMVKTLKERGLRIDAVGMQGHIGMDYPSYEEYQAAIDAYAAAGVKVMITELELSALPTPRPNVGANISDTEAYQAEMNPYTEGLPDSVAQAWTTRMADFFTLFVKNSDKISRVTLWGVSDGDSWKNDFPMRGRTDYPLLFDRNHQPKAIVNKIIAL